MKNKGFTIVELCALLIILGILALILIPLIFMGKGFSNNTKTETTTTEKPMVVGECDWFGVQSESIISNKKEQGYTFTGRTTNFYCENYLMFELKEEK